MQDLKKISVASFLAYWKSLSYGLLIVLGIMLLSQALPYFFAPVVALVGAAVLYTILYNNKLHNSSTCMITTYSLFFCTISYSFVSIVLNILYIWGMVPLPRELTFFYAPYVPSLILDPVCFITLVIMYFRLSRLRYCMNCKLKNGPAISRGQFGEILHRESRLQMKNLIALFAILSALVWVYYYTYYDRNADMNYRDWYVFFWLNVAVIAIDEIYFAIRAYNLYLDLKENDEIITEEELSEMTAKTYLRFYVVCENSIYLNTHVVDPQMPYRQIIDTPFVTKRNVNGITTNEVSGIVHGMVDEPGELRFFFGRKNPDIAKHSLLRYFYFLDGTPEDYPELKAAGEWVDFNRLKNIYNSNPTMMSKTLMADISRMTTIVLTQKIYDSRGFRKVKIKSYIPSYDLKEIRHGDYDFQDDLWMRIAMFNSDTKGFRISRLWNRPNKRKKATWKEGR